MPLNPLSPSPRQGVVFTQLKIILKNRVYLNSFIAATLSRPTRNITESNNIDEFYYLLSTVKQGSSRYVLIRFISNVAF